MRILRALFEYLHHARLLGQYRAACLAPNAHRGQFARLNGNEWARIKSAPQHGRRIWALDWDGLTVYADSHMIREIDDASVFGY